MASIALRTTVSTAPGIGGSEGAAWPGGAGQALTPMSISLPGAAGATNTHLLFRLGLTATTADLGANAAIQPGWMIGPTAVTNLITQLSATASGAMGVSVNWALNIAWTGSFQIWFRVWRCAAGRGSATRVTLPGEASSYLQSVTVTPGAATSGTLSPTALGVSAQTFITSAPYLHIEMGATPTAVGVAGATLTLTSAIFACPAITYPQAAADTAASSDAATRSATVARATNDTAAASDAAGRQLTTIRAALDTAAAADLATRGVVTGRVTTDAASAADAATRAVNVRRTTSDAAPASDTGVRRLVLLRSAADTAPAADVAARRITVGRGAADTAAAVDAATRHATAARTAADTAPASDTASRRVGLLRSATDNLAASTTTVVAPVYVFDD